MARESGGHRGSVMKCDAVTSPAEERVFLKQYGAERSGTNYLKRLLELNFTNVVVLGSVLGWKHGLYETRSGADPHCASHEGWLEACSRGEDVFSVDGHRLPFTRAELQESIPKLRYVVSTKSLESWVRSFKQFRANNRAWCVDEVVSWCRRWLSAHERWADLLETRGGVVVEFEDLLRGFSPVLKTIESRFRLTRRGRELVNEPRIVNASTDSGLLFSAEHFDATAYQDRDGTHPIPAEIRWTIESFEPDAAKLLCRLRSAGGLWSYRVQPASETTGS